MVDVELELESNTYRWRRRRRRRRRKRRRKCRLEPSTRLSSRYMQSTLISINSENDINMRRRRRRRRLSMMIQLYFYFSSYSSSSSSMVSMRLQCLFMSCLFYLLLCSSVSANLVLWNVANPTPLPNSTDGPSSFSNSVSGSAGFPIDFGGGLLAYEFAGYTAKKNFHAVSGPILQLPDIGPDCTFTPPSTTSSFVFQPALPSNVTGSIVLVDMGAARNIGCVSMSFVLQLMPAMSDELHRRYADLPPIRAIVFANPIDSSTTFGNPMTTFYDNYWNYLPANVTPFLTSGQSYTWMTTQMDSLQHRSNNSTAAVNRTMYTPLLGAINHDIGVWNRLIGDSISDRIQMARQIVCTLVGLYILTNIFLAVFIHKSMRSWSHLSILAFELIPCLAIGLTIQYFAYSNIVQFLMFVGQGMNKISLGLLIVRWTFYVAAERGVKILVAVRLFMYIIMASSILFRIGYDILLYLCHVAINPTILFMLMPTMDFGGGVLAFIAMVIYARAMGKAMWYAEQRKITYLCMLSLATSIYDILCYYVLSSPRSQNIPRTLAYVLLQTIGMPLSGALKVWASIMMQSAISTTRPGFSTGVVRRRERGGQEDGTGPTNSHVSRRDRDECSGDYGDASGTFGSATRSDGGERRQNRRNRRDQQQSQPRQPRQQRQQRQRQMDEIPGDIDATQLERVRHSGDDFTLQLPLQPLQFSLATLPYSLHPSAGITGSYALDVPTHPLPTPSASSTPYYGPSRVSPRTSAPVTTAPATTTLTTPASPNPPRSTTESTASLPAKPWWNRILKRRPSISTVKSPLPSATDRLRHSAGEYNQFVNAASFGSSATPIASVTASIPLPLMPRSVRTSSSGERVNDVNLAARNGLGLVQFEGDTGVRGTELPSISAYVAQHQQQLQQQQQQQQLQQAQQQQQQQQQMVTPSHRQQPALYPHRHVAAVSALDDIPRFGTPFMPSPSLAATPHQATGIPLGYTHGHQHRSLSTVPLHPIYQVPTATVSARTSLQQPSQTQQPPPPPSSNTRIIP
ncbi:hypothetical protein GQ42DRAFT_31122 [Ramicandelaber brevisporus]|nr:hypothetical protein GQ42DRAFT_31122 [Ramicandelaber brevisporus]